MSIFIPDKLMVQIESFQYRERVPSRVQAIRMLVGRGLMNDAFGEPRKKRKSAKTSGS